MPHTVTPFALPEILILEHEVFGDARGFFETFNQRNFAQAAGLNVRFLQDNHRQLWCPSALPTAFW